MTKTPNETRPRSTSPAPSQEWPSIWASPATWEAGTVAHRTGKMPSYSRRAAARPTQGW